MSTVSDLLPRIADYVHQQLEATLKYETITAERSGWFQIERGGKVVLRYRAPRITGQIAPTNQGRVLTTLTFEFEEFPNEQTP